MAHVQTTLADREARAKAGKDLPHATVTVTWLSGDALFNEAQAINNKLIDLRIAAARKTEDQIEAEKRTRKGSQKDPNAEEQAALEARLLQITQDELPAEQSPAEMVGMPSGEWQRWREAHPARIIGYRETTKPNGDVETGDPIYHPDDIELTKVMPWSVAPSCNAAEVDELLLDRFIVTVGGEELKPGGWLGWLADAIVWANRRDLVRAAVLAQEQSVPRLPKAPTSPATPSDSGSSDSPETSESLASDS